jgi:hypothetical protein
VNEPENLTLCFLRSLDRKLDTVADRLQFVGFRGELAGLRGDRAL